MDYVTDETLAALGAAANHLVDLLNAVPGFPHIVRYVERSLEHDPWRLFLEVILVIVLINYVVRRQNKPKESRTAVKLTPKEIDEIIDEWTPAPLVPEPNRETERINKNTVVLDGESGVEVTIGGKKVLNMTSLNFLGLCGDQQISKAANETLRKYGVGSCGPPGFYGTLDVHMELEKKIANFFGAEEAILYSFGFSTLASAIPAYAKKGDIIVADECVHFAIQRGLAVSRANIYYFRHNDMADLERILIKIDTEHKKSKRALTRRFLVVEGIYQYVGDIAPLKDIVALKNKYKYRLFVDESISLGVLGETGRGIVEHAGLKSSDVELLMGGMSAAVGSAGGFCAGSSFIVDHQRLSGQGYTYSASMPAMLAVACMRGFDAIEKHPEAVRRLRDNARRMRSLLRGTAGMLVIGDDITPIIHVRLADPAPNRDDNEDLLQEIVNKALEKGVLFTRAHYVQHEEVNLPPPSIRIAVSSAHTDAQLENAANVLKNAFKECIAAAKH